MIGPKHFRFSEARTFARVVSDKVWEEVKINKNGAKTRKTNREREKKRKIEKGRERESDRERE